MNNNHHESHRSAKTTKKTFSVLTYFVSFVFSCLSWQMAGVIDA